jgi:serine/threonine protein kinase
MGHTGLLRRRSHRKEVGMRVRHPNIGEIVDSGKDQGFYFHVSPLYQPGSLSRYCAGPGAQRGLSWCVQVVLEALAGLAAAGQEGFVHLDIKPGNLVLDGKRIRIIDWGLSRNWQDEDLAYTHVPRGSVFFASPEQIARPAPGWDNPLADLYGVGAVFYWLITNEPPLCRDVKVPDLFGVHQLISAGVRPRRVDALLTGVPPEIGELIDGWLSYEPEQRVPAGTSAGDSLLTARRQLSALRDRIPKMTVGTTDDRRGGNGDRKRWRRR